MGCNSSVQLASVLQPSSRAKVLCLHGGGSNSIEFSNQLKPVHEAMRALGGGPELVYLNGPLDARGMPDEAERSQVAMKRERKWRFCSGGGGSRDKYGGARDLEAWFLRASEAHGPFLGVMGFGEGGAAAALFAGIARPGRVLRAVPPSRGAREWLKVPPLQCLVSLCAPQLWDLDVKGRAQEVFSQGPLPVMSLHIIGEADDLRHPDIDNTLQLFKNPLVRYHQEGHRPLPSGEEEAEKLAKTIVGFLRQQATDRPFLPAEKR